MVEAEVRQVVVDRSARVQGQVGRPPLPPLRRGVVLQLLKSRIKVPDARLIWSLSSPLARLLAISRQITQQHTTRPPRSPDTSLPNPAIRQTPYASPRYPMADADADTANGSDAAAQTVAAMAEADNMSADEIALYDRQIRLWGVQAQEKIRTANILLVSIKALANEIAKNLVLAGIGSITLADRELVTEDDLGAQFLLSQTDVGKNVGGCFFLRFPITCSRD